MHEPNTITPFDQTSVQAETAPVIKPTVEVVPNPNVSPIWPNEEQQLTMRALASTTGQILSPLVGTPGLGQEALDSQAEVMKATTTAIRNSWGETWQSWRADTVGGKLSRLSGKSIAWLNLVFGETAALFVQGVAQNEGMTSSASFATNMLAALLIEGTSASIAARPFKDTERKSPQTVAEASALGFWLGGAMGVENKQLPPSQAKWPVAAYMTFAAGLAAVGEITPLASEVVAQKHIVIPSLVVWGGLKKAHEFFEYKGYIEKFADKMTPPMVRAATPLIKAGEKITGTQTGQNVVALKDDLTIGTKLATRSLTEPVKQGIKQVLRATNPARRAWQRLHKTKQPGVIHPEIIEPISTLSDTSQPTHGTAA